MFWANIADSPDRIGIKKSHLQNDKIFRQHKSSIFTNRIDSAKLKTTKKKIIVSVTNDLVSDNRVHKVCTTLLKMGFDVLLVGRKLPHSADIERDYGIKRMRLIFKKGACFYAEYNFRLFCFLLFAKSNILLSNDLDSLTANFLASRLKRIPLVYDSHEYFTEVPELIERSRVQKIWEWLEAKMLPHVKFAYTVCDSIANAYHNKYGTEFKVVRNLPQKKELNLQKNELTKKLILYQGAVNVARGLEQAIRAMKNINGAELVIAGDGDIRAELEKLVKADKLETKVRFTGRLPLEKLSELTTQADLGLSIEEDKGLNYRFALPNKLFDYIQAQVPVLVTNLPEMAAIVRKYNIGSITDSLEPAKLAENIKEALYNPEKRTLWKENLPAAAKELVWENEEKVLIEIFSNLLDK